ncbi:MurR/RpiR family transcriptional regulator [Lactococcus laudensis]|uniref:MurR/RpiR family transcriptional regulator n=1 Tax=Pseudolactococcus laudensis TaxID=1494461 RepID=A0A7V8MZE0_9LACT|nr:MurR/RpiR family transcriptional regulator [Lactococcus laudensis]MBA0015786.1 MurR/RpiR family transcriptional regulator [Lactococcus laudensis]
MFEIEKIKKLNETEFQIYNFLMEHMADVSKMTIRELAQMTHVSAATIVRFCRHLGFAGFSELKFHMMQANHYEPSLESYYANFLELNSFLKGLTGATFQKKLAQACQMIEDSAYTVFRGAGTSGALSKYGYRYFNSVGIQAIAITDGGYQNACLIVLSVTGENKGIMERVLQFKQNGVKIISITNDEKSTISKLSDLNFSYYMIDEYASNKSINKLILTTQLPVLALIEILAHHVRVAQ